MGGPIVRIGELMMKYISAGFKSRQEYLDSLAVEFNVDYSTVYFMASRLGADEDFRGLVEYLEESQFENA